MYCADVVYAGSALAVRHAPAQARVRIESAMGLQAVPGQPRDSGHQLGLDKLRFVTGDEVQGVMSPCN